MEREFGPLFVESTPEQILSEEHAGLYLLMIDLWMTDLEAKIAWEEKPLLERWAILDQEAIVRREEKYLLQS